MDVMQGIPFWNDC